jgi:dTDP-4-amino-4,6-dideoxygalactose transaminase
MTLTTTAAASGSAQRVPFARTPISPAAVEAVSDVLRSGWVTTGPQVAAFEQEFAASVSTRHAVAVSSCTAAIELALRAMRLPAGAPVLTSTVTFCGAVNAILHAGLRPVLVDIHPDTLMPDAESVAAAVRRAGRPSAAVVLHYAGYPAPVAAIAEAARLPLTRVIEDAAHAVGTYVADTPVGGISAASCFSFYATKNLPIGEGGMVTTDDDAIAGYVRRCRLHGMSRDAWKRHLPGSNWRYTVEDAGLKANMTDVQAAIGRAQLREVPRWQRQREALATRYDEQLADVPGIVRPARPENGKHAWHLYVVRVTPEFRISRDGLIVRLAEVGIDCSVHFIPVHHQPYVRRLLGADAEAVHFPVAEAMFQQYVSLPAYPDLTEAEVDRVSSEIANAHSRTAASTSVAHNGSPASVHATERGNRNDSNPGP